MPAASLNEDLPAQSAFRVLEFQIYRGPNLYSRQPMARLRLDLGHLEHAPSNSIPGFNQRLLSLLPGLRSHGCSCPDAGGFEARLRDGTWLGHVIEHIALELQTAAGNPVSRGKTRGVSGRSGVYDVLFRYEIEALAKAAGAAAVRLVASQLPTEFSTCDEGGKLPPPLTPFPSDVQTVIAALSQLRAASALGPTTQALVNAARRRGIPVTRLDAQSLIQLGWGSNQKRLRASITGETAQIAVSLACNKAATRTALLDAGLPVPRGTVVRSAGEARQAAAALGGSVVIKPLDGNHGRGVTTDITDAADIDAAFLTATKVSRRVIVEEQLQGNDYRILVVKGEVVAVAERRPAHIVGDGNRTIEELISIVNTDERRGDGHENVLTRIKIDDELHKLLAKQGRSLDDVPAAGEHVVLRGTANLSSGGTAIDRTDEIHPENRLISETAVKLIGLDVAGVDFISPDITQPTSKIGGGIIEINAAPGFRMHLAPAEGPARDVAAPVIEMLFPKRQASRIPIISVTGTNGKTTTVRMISAIIRASGRRVGMTNTSGVYLDDLQLKAADASGPRSARMVLQNPAVDVAVLETARGGILREGLAYDLAAVGVVLNVTEDHLGLKGIDTVAQLAAVKSVVARNVARHGTAVLNYDDPHVRAMAREVRSKVAWFSLAHSADDAFLAGHISAGGTAAVVETIGSSAILTLYRHGRRFPLLGTAEVPAAAGGAASFNIANALAAIAATASLDVKPEIITEALRAFTSNYEDNPGRFNVMDDHPFRVIIDYAHNPAALEAIGQCLWLLRPHPLGRVIGMVSIPGDRRDADIKAVGKVAAQMFDHVVFREGPDGRGRPRGAVLRLMEAGALEAATSVTFQSVLEEHDAVDLALRIASPGDLLVLLPTRIEDVFAQVKRFCPAEVEIRAAS